MRNATGEQLSLLMDEPDAAFHVHASHRLETLAELLAEEIRRSPAEPLEQERIVVPDALLGQWLRLELATHLGIAAHLRVELPAEFAWAAMREEVKALTGESVYGPPYLRWRIFDRLGSWAGDGEIGSYLVDGDPRKRFELADRLAVAYDRCRVYRPENIRAWQRGPAEDWYARLWAELAAADSEPRHWVDAIDSYREALAGRAPATKKRVNFFQVAEMSPTYVEALRLAASVMDVHLYVLSPSRHFWTGPTGRAGEAGKANELLDAWGRSARDLRDQLLAEPNTVVVASGPREGDVPRAATCLAAVQRDILGATPDTPDSPAEPAGSADSIQVHVCHSPTREVEILHDRLLGIFDSLEDIQPADVLVLTPDIDTYAPLIEAVFGAADRIGFSIGTRRLKEGAALTAFLDLLALPGSRYTATDLLAPLLAESVRHCFGITDTDLATLRGAVARSRVRWGKNGEHRTELDVPASANHNWRRGLDRLLLGYALDEGDVLAGGINPCALDGRGFHDGAADYELLGRFHRYCELAVGLGNWITAEQEAAGWTSRLRSDVLDEFFDAGIRTGSEAAREVRTVSRLIEEFDEQCRQAGNTGPIPFAVLREVLNELAAQSVRSPPRLADGIAVASLASGQIFPAKVVCTVGMNDRAFPRRSPPDVFDFEAELFDREQPKPGDPDRRDSDRFAFLEALLAARNCFVVTCTGRDLQEDKPIPPSVLVSELLDYLAERFPASEPEPRDRWRTEHPLQPFSRRYFTTDIAGERGEEAAGAPAERKLFSFSHPMLQAAKALRSGGEAPRRFDGQLDADPNRPDDDAPLELELEDLIRFSESPSRAFLRDRLGMALSTREDDVENDEPLDLNALEVWQLKSELSGKDNLDDEATLELAAARGLLPAANLGRIEHRQSAAQVAELNHELKHFDAQLEAEVQGLEVDLEGVRLIGAVEQFDAATNELLFWRIGSVRPKDRIATWLRLLALIGSRNEAASARLLGCGRELQKVQVLGPDPATARSLLADWTEVWRESRRRPLPFFARTSWEWLEKQAWNANVERAWSGQSYSEGNRPSHQLIFNGKAEGVEFEDLARRLLGPLKEASS
ncbi:MAG: exodeoxyribonuclease V subunit gamma [Holophagales bacterium]|nr:exodeoxyribonuclease V subunit gamma [Holophagales bacterium]MXW02316.1 exodeoxyribonuclease V subunit gamma [Holophagales bacterium]MYC09714.1 exodeoxyribonuclease V subunit gamma [Holophagales bacterium]